LSFASHFLHPEYLKRDRLEDAIDKYGHTPAIVFSASKDDRSRQQVDAEAETTIHRFFDTLKAARHLNKIPFEMPSLFEINPENFRRRYAYEVSFASSFAFNKFLLVGLQRSMDTLEIYQRLQAKLGDIDSLGPVLDLTFKAAVHSLFCETEHQHRLVLLLENERSVKRCLRARKMAPTGSERIWSLDEPAERDVRLFKTSEDFGGVLSHHIEKGTSCYLLPAVLTLSDFSSFLFLPAHYSPKGKLKTPAKVLLFCITRESTCTVTFAHLEKVKSLFDSSSDCVKALLPTSERPWHVISTVPDGCELELTLESVEGEEFPAAADLGQRKRDHDGTLNAGKGLPGVPSWKNKVCLWVEKIAAAETSGKRAGATRQMVSFPMPAFLRHFSIWMLTITLKFISGPSERIDTNSCRHPPIVLLCLSFSGF
jgi:hypothetical protein